MANEGAGPASRKVSGAARMIALLRAGMAGGLTLEHQYAVRRYISDLMPKGTWRYRKWLWLCCTTPAHISTFLGYLMDCASIVGDLNEQLGKEAANEWLAEPRDLTPNSQPVAVACLGLA
jgi:hypothetical protein